MGYLCLLSVVIVIAAALLHGGDDLPPYDRPDDPPEMWI